MLKDKEEIEKNVADTQSVIYSDPVSSIIQTDVVSAIKNCDGDKIAVLNFASFTFPGSNYLNGMPSQEAELCNHSHLFEILKSFEASWYSPHRQNGRHGLYENVLLYTPDVMFSFSDDTKRNVDVITCAAPNWKYFKQVDMDPRLKNLKNMHEFRKRAALVFKSAVLNNCDTLVLGDWGCEEYEQDPFKVAAVLKTTALCFPEIKCLFAVRDSYNFEAFKTTFKEI